ncbi:MAG: vWA domain-containing protein [Gammaproteobacteria bacterium]|nr:vWA domain-containing protein [Gammaproteobacteria bacterium]
MTGCRARRLRRRGVIAAMRLPVLAGLAAWAMAAGALSAAPAPAADVRFVVDGSAAMARSDPDNVRSGALGMLLRLLPESGRAGVWTYGEHVNELVEYGVSDGLWQENAVIRTRNLTTVGQGSNLFEALDQASWDRHQPGAGPAQLILLTDGRRHDGDDPADSAAHRQRLLTELIPELNEADFTLHVVSLSEAAEQDSLGQLAALTGGIHASLPAPRTLPEELLAMLGWLTGPAGLPVSAAGGFQVAPGTRSLTVLRLGASLDESVTLVTPGGDRLTRTTSRERVRWHVADGYELVSLARPAPGAWRFEGPAEGVHVQAYGDLQVVYQDLPATLFPGGLRRFEFALMSGSSEIRDADFLDLLDVSAQLRGSDGTTPLVVERTDAGRFQVNLLGPREQGDYQLDTRVSGPTFTQELTLPLALRNPLSIEVHPADDGFVVWATVAAPELDHEGLRLAGMVKRPPAAARLFPMERNPAGLWKLAVPGGRGLVELTLDLRGSYLNGREFELRTEPIRVILPVSEVSQVNLDLRGQPLLVAASEDRADDGNRQAAGFAGAPPAAAAPGASRPGPAAAQAFSLPVWLALMVGLMNLVMGGSLWWLLGTPQYSAERHAMLDRLRELARVDDAAAEPHAAAT